MSITSLVFGITLIIMGYVAISHLTGFSISFSGASLKGIARILLVIFKIALGLLFGVAFCLLFSAFGGIGAIVGAILGFILGWFLIAIFRWLFKHLKWWGILLVVVALVSAFLATL